MIREEKKVSKKDMTGLDSNRVQRLRASLYLDISEDPNAVFIWYTLISENYIGVFSNIWLLKSYTQALHDIQEPMKDLDIAKHNSFPSAMIYLVKTLGIDKAKEFGLSSVRLLSRNILFKNPIVEKYYNDNTGLIETRILRDIKDITRRSTLTYRKQAYMRKPYLPGKTFIFIKTDEHFGIFDKTSDAFEMLNYLELFGYNNPLTRKNKPIIKHFNIYSRAYDFLISKLTLKERVDEYRMLGNCYPRLNRLYVKEIEDKKY